jgi:hypothetical protein
MSITTAAMALTIRTGRPWTSGTPPASRWIAAMMMPMLRISSQPALTRAA